MAEMLSPGVFLTEIDASTIVPTVSNSIGVFCGDFTRGPVGSQTLITSVADLITFFGKPNNTNYNDFYQAYNFLQYGNKLMISRASNVTGTTTLVAGNTVLGNAAVAYNVAHSATNTTAITAVGWTPAAIPVTAGAGVVEFADGASIVFDNGAGVVDTANVYTVAVGGSLMGTAGTIAITEVALGADIPTGATVYEYFAGGVQAAVAAGSTLVTVQNPNDFAVNDTVSFETTVGGGVDTANSYVVTSINANTHQLTLGSVTAAIIPLNSAIFKVESSMNAVFEAVSSGGVATILAEYLTSSINIENTADFEAKVFSIAMGGADSKVKLIARNPGAWGNNLEIAVATPSAFGTVVPSFAFDGVPLDALFEYAPTGTEIGIIVRDGGSIVETWTVDFDQAAKDHNNKSTYIEDVINTKSSYIYAIENTANLNPIQNYCFSVNGVVGSTITPLLGANGVIQNADLQNAYDVFNNKEQIDIDIVISNELDAGISAKNLVDARQDCIAFVGAEYGDVVGQKSTTAVANLVAWRQTGNLNFNDMFVVACGNYKYQYDRYNDKYRWINIAGDVAGLRAQANTNRATWWASAGLERGQIKNVTKIAYNPTQGQRDLLYKLGINPIVAFPNQGTVMWGQKTLLDKPSSFDRVNVRGLFNTLERAMSKMAKYQVMAFNDNFTRNRIVSMIKPYLGTVQAGRGIQDFLVICDESNNTADIISRNQLIVDIYIKPTYVAEFIQLRLTNAGTRAFSEIIG